MSRLPDLHYDDLESQGQQIWDAVVGSRGGMINEHGGLFGPYNAFVRAPELGSLLVELGVALRSRTSLDARLAELAVITVGARWRAEFAWWAHRRVALRRGVPGAVVDAIGRDQEPPFEADDERAVYQVARQLATAGRLDDSTYATAAQLLGETGLVELVSLCGYYTAVCFLLNGFEVDLPVGIIPFWDN